MAGAPAQRRWPVALAAVLFILLGGSLIAALFTSRELEGAVPGKAAILGLAVVPDGYLIGTANGAFVSRNGRVWTRVDVFSGTTLVATAGSEALVLNAGRIFESTDLEAFVDRGEAVAEVTALSGNTSSAVYLATGDGRFYVTRGGEQPAVIEAQGGPGDVITLGASDSTPAVLLAGGLTSGLWRSENGGLAWTRLLGTPTRYAMLDARSRRGFIATAGGVLASDDGRDWTFTDLREPVEALAQTSDTYFAITSSRLLYTSSNGLEWQAQVLAE